MAASARALDGFATKSTFVCPDCGHEARLASAGNSGVFLAGGFIATGAIAAVMAASRGFSQTDAIVTGLLLAFFSMPSVMETIARVRHPVTGTRALRDDERVCEPATPDEPLERGVTLIDRLGFATGFLGLVVFVVLWLVFWAAVGLIGEAFF